MDSLIFDLDGTLWDATENVCYAWNKTLREEYPALGQLRQEDFFAQMGKPLHDIGLSLFPQIEDESYIDEVLHRCCVVENDYLLQMGGVLYEGIEQTLCELSKRWRLFIVSNCQNGYIEAFLAAHSLGGYFADFQCGGNGLSKAENIKLTVKRNGLTAPVYVGDTELDGISANEANVPFVWAAYGFGKAKDYIAKLDSFTELLTIAEEL